MLYPMLNGQVEELIGHGRFGKACLYNFKHVLTLLSEDGTP